jgi:hypothetical protein
MRAVSPVRGIALLVVALLLAACATGGPAAVGGRQNCAEDQRGSTGLNPMFFVFCLQSP